MGPYFWIHAGIGGCAQLAAVRQLLRRHCSSSYGCGTGSVRREHTGEYATQTRRQAAANTHTYIIIVRNSIRHPTGILIPYKWDTSHLHALLEARVRRPAPLRQCPQMRQSEASPRG